ncbi:2-phosphosulfolactate phosphatase family protein [Anabaena cylindrica FACHB-243]|uniref:Probable 2-phosphosulfolactate phosphatase n=1 Tax=Anabaena cylindrica (strain ATCC 27899 / PCC 7122) TaxID=272123 RepID=K9ZJC4_ANACC|nr:MULTISPECIES: 2-phosphosulfolactate phosphatase family protein [Anabaena]AFZ58869.1 2-phosphosulfolactate phosphatase [Anabaena cylindrica PCC 7122]MBD2419454.1 2-phosphosulfolactate phosphatase family protein [Anabaena cylindrica FACHB-243]MBY5283799.1 2-phosphosulfolactate phosphatase family protein [Anabaena sp. CCAP 1446/1C]MBY5306205.1 2-phosphosulfolactate phosphatase family protein [Anabaena sp. CCAP 1446/1C]MCM2408363.1 2-phosphosulfolactate phosphatase family protein [Anabaena sp. 
MKIFVYHTPELTPTDEAPECAIAVDVLRATSTMATVLAAGGEAVQVFSDLDQLVEVSEKWPSEKRLRAGERGGAKVAGFELGNSPLDCTAELVQGRRLFISTTNGTRALKRIQNAPIVLAAALINRAAVVKFLLEKQPETVWIVGSGWEGSFSLEDTVCAGAIAHSICQQTNSSLEDLTGNDEVTSAIALYSQWQNDLLGLFYQASHGKRLLRLECLEDLKYCSQTDILDILPIQQEPGVLKSHNK